MILRSTLRSIRREAYCTGPFSFRNERNPKCGIRFWSKSVPRSVTEATDVNGQPIDSTGGFYGSTLLSHPRPFKCQIEPRTPSAKALN
ncbi:uncharacterized protein BT62DRAFT_510679 [Guyanagaster necrorhizus]|uniref:Uncharacterized protein n=1 Tax=Guyanagaster necrorhizus TaxID=856835 RepID=A0A9P7W0N3_9AGAR|nr:uncharacterized protein BT62DRAFT_510679 [Guyanagaster necrorhizus MCA 3950]KAG7450414.1 hypothetical protein BT62DRAFT_510679 [Guyanagaster necrorhizus MCA 3950]